ncbi:hypothetical protein [Pontibacter russatus]|uniref:hypothetical protein n=1 Tax=Pontibacter russatus TaxID=2694929 RepID=UPI00137B49A2|nr:hypothetical protein [Pontibacter russatus]
MKELNDFEYPRELQPEFEKARSLEWLPIAYLISTALAMHLITGHEDRLVRRHPQPYPVRFVSDCLRGFPQAPEQGYHRVVSIAYLCSALALFSVGAFLVFDSAMSLVSAEHATIGTVVVFVQQIWLGYLMIAALLWALSRRLSLGAKSSSSPPNSTRRTSIRMPR